MREVNAPEPATRPATRGGLASRGPAAPVPFLPGAGSPRSPRHLLALQRAAGNGAVRQLLAPVVQRCGDHISPGCACAEGHDVAGDAAMDAAPVVARDGPGDPPADCKPPGTRRAGSDPDSVDGALKDNCLDEAYGILNSKAMFDLLPLLLSLASTGTFAKLRASAGGMGGPRMQTAIAVVDLKLRGNPTGYDLPGLDSKGMWGLPKDQRRDITRFLDLVISVGKFRVDASYCAGGAGEGCIGKVKFMINYKRLMIQEYAACEGNKKLTGAMVENHVVARMGKLGYPSERKASTGAAGDVSGKPPDPSQCGPIWDYGIYGVHEPHHVSTGIKMRAKHGGGPGTKAFDKEWNARDAIARDEVEANTLELNFFVAVEKALAILEGEVR